VESLVAAVFVLGIKGFLALVAFFFAGMVFPFEFYERQ
jgi:hypothetical protein